MIISQKYQGDITIVPPVAALDYISLMKNPDHTELQKKVKLAEKASWQSKLPRLVNPSLPSHTPLFSAELSIIEMHCRTEKVIDGILYRLRIRQLERQGKAYRPMDFALSLTMDDDEDTDMGKRSQSLGSNLAGAGLPKSFEN